MFQIPDLALKAFAVIGALVVIRFVLQVLSGIWSWLFAPSFNYKRFQGKWAVVTGASDGLGAGFARNLARRGVNVVLLARTTSKLDAIVKEINDQGKAKAKAIQFDFSSTDAKYWEEKVKQLLEVQPDVLINNVGINVEFPTPFVDVPADFYDKMVQVNINTANRLTRFLLPGMLERKRGAVVFLSSGLGFMPGGLLSVYGATKAYALTLAVNLQQELAGTGVIVQCYAPGLVQSLMSKVPCYCL